MRRGWPGGIFLGFLFFVSGFTGLVYEVIWAKYLALLLGSTAYAQIGVLAVFMGGLALGSAIWGRSADRGTHPLRLYGLLEIGVGVSVALLAVSFDVLSSAYWSALAVAGNAGLGAAVVKTLLCLAAMLAPTICMGGTLPVLSRALGLQRRSFGRGVAYLYAINSLGAASGSVLTGFALVPRWGIDTPFVAAAAVNLVVGVAALLLDRRFVAGPGVAAATESATVDGTEAGEIRGYRILIPLCAAVSGAVAMVYEVAWIRLCSLVLGSSTYAFSIMLTAFIVGIATGSFAYTLVNPTARRPLRFFVYSSLAAVAVLLICLPLYERLPFLAARLTWMLRQIDASFGTHQAAMLGLCVAVMLPLTFTSGLNFPALAHAAAAVHGGVGRPVSYVLFANTAGTILGTVAAGLYLLPAIGLENTFLLGCGATVAVVLLVLLCDRSLSRRRLTVVTLTCTAAAVAYVVFVPRWDLRLLTLGEFRQHDGLAPRPFAEYRREIEQEIVYYRDGASATVSVERWPTDLVLRLNGKADASATGDRGTQLLLGHLPAVLHPTARQALVIGYGSGMTAGALLRHPLASIDVVEISPEVMEADAWFREYTGNPLGDPRTHVFVEDARTFLYRTPHKYDLIVSEPSNPWLAGVANLFTAEFFEQVKSRLADDGVFVQWFHTYESSNAVVAMILRTVAQGFAEVRVFQPNVWDVMVIASPSPLRNQPQSMQRAFARATELPEIGIPHLSTLLGLEVLSNRSLRSLLTPGSINHDRQPLLEYAAPRAFFEGRDANLVTNAPATEADDFLQAPGDLSFDELRELLAYMRRSDMLPFTNNLRFLSEWMRRDPMAPPLLEMIALWSAERPMSPQLISTLMRNVPKLPDAVRLDYLRGLLHALRTVVPRPALEQVRSVEPLARALASERGKSEPLQLIGNLYLRAGGNAEALAVFDALVGDPKDLSPEQQLRLQCARGQALAGLKRAADAVTAYRTCSATSDAVLRRQAEEEMRRLSAER